MKSDLYTKNLRSSIRLPEIRREFKSRDLACWCRRDRPSHANILLQIASQEVG